MRRRIRTVVVVLSALVLTSMAVTALTAEERHYLGGAVLGTQAKTNTSVVFTQNISTPGNPGPFERLASSELTVHVNAGESDLFVYEFDAQCQIHYGGDEDYINLHARVNGFVGGVIGGPAILQPQTVPSFLVTCPGASLVSNVSAKSWVARLSGGSDGADYTFTIWWRVVDLSPANPGVRALLSDRIVKVTRYN